MSCPWTLRWDFRRISLLSLMGKLFHGFDSLVAAKGQNKVEGHFVGKLLKQQQHI